MVEWPYNIDEYKGKYEQDVLCGRWNEWDGMWTEGNKMKHQWSVDWQNWDETWTMKLIM